MPKRACQMQPTKEGGVVTFSPKCPIIDQFQEEGRPRLTACINGHYTPEGKFVIDDVCQHYVKGSIRGDFENQDLDIQCNHL